MTQKKNILLTGAPSSGKTTVIKKIIKNLNIPACGFYTQEEKQIDKRVGFLMRSLNGKKAYLAHQNIESEYRIRRYGVSISNIENIAVPSIYPKKNIIIVLDEIGKMECFSEKFRIAAIKALDSENIVIGTVTLGGGDFIEKIKQRQDIEILEVTPENRNSLPSKILEKVNALTDKK